MRMAVRDATARWHRGENIMMDNWMMTGGFGLTHGLFFVIMLAVVLYPIGRILNRLGLSPLWSVLAVIPFINLIAVWVLAFADWPEYRRP
jgi:hypothetical protein